jgi:(4S)-4-hydroxy-5-phosphonooxypentane-2,3-dione isomerase
MQVLVVEFHIKPHWIAAFESAIAENARLSRETEPGCRQFDVCRSAANPALFFLYELYDDEAAVQEHLRSPHFLHMNELTAFWIEKKTVSRYTRTAP